MLTKRQRDIVAATLRSVIDEVVSEHFDAETQEHQLTSRLAAILERELRPLTVLGKQVVVVTQEFPDKGPGSLEKKTGVDLYIGFVDLGEDGFSKGLFMQAKWHTIKRSAAEAQALTSQCDKMLQISGESFVLLYGPEGAEVVRAQDVVRQPETRPERLPSRKTDEVFQKVMECTEGDPRWGPDKVMVLNGSARKSVSGMMEELRIKTAVAVVMNDGVIDFIP